MNSRSANNAARTLGNLRILFAVPQLNSFQRARHAEEGDAAYLLLAQIADSLRLRGHEMTYFGGAGLLDNAVVGADDSAQKAEVGWSGTLPFEFSRRCAWRIQQALGVPYLNVFSNLRLRDAASRLLSGVDVVYERSSLYRSGLARACCAAGKPYLLFVDADEIMELDAVETPLRGLQRGRAVRIFRHNLRSAAHIVCVSEVTRERLINQWRVPRERISVMANAVDVNRFRPDREARENVRRELGVGESPVVIFVGNFYLWHDVPSLLRAFALVLRDRPNATLLLLGDGAERPRAEMLAAELELGATVRFLGRTSHSRVPSYLASADVSVAPYIATEKEMWMSPLKAYESMAAGTPLVASAVGQLRDSIRHGEEGLLTQPEDVDGLYNAISRLLDDGACARRVAGAARRKVVENNSWPHYAERLEGLLRDIVAEGSNQGTEASFRRPALESSSTPRLRT